MNNIVKYFVPTKLSICLSRMYSIKSSNDLSILLSNRFSINRSIFTLVFSEFELNEKNYKISEVLAGLIQLLFGLKAKRFGIWGCNTNYTRLPLSCKIFHSFFDKIQGVLLEEGEVS